MVRLKNKGFDARYLEYPWNFFGICAVHISVSDWSDMEQLTVGRRTEKRLVNYNFCAFALKLLALKISLAALCVR